MTIEATPPRPNVDQRLLNWIHEHSEARNTWTIALAVPGFVLLVVAIVQDLGWIARLSGALATMAGFLSIGLEAFLERNVVKALSKFSPNHRDGLTPLRLEGRDSDFAKLSGRNECLLLGQPGSGKTALLSAFCWTTNSYFVVERDVSLLARDIARCKPDTLIIDDAHNNAELARAAINVRNERGLTFRLVLVSWPWFEDGLQRDYGYSKADTSRLDALDADALVDIIRRKVPNLVTWAIREVRQQSRGRPGLAATLASAIVDDTTGVISGEVLLNELLAHHPDSSNVLSVIATFSAGGSKGLALSVAAEALEISPAAILSVLTRLAPGGVVSQHRDHVYSVHPLSLRAVLLEREYFSAERYVLLRNLVLAATSPTAALETLVGCVARGREPDEAFLRTLLTESGHEKAVTLYAATGRDNFNWCMESFPGLDAELLATGLRLAPETTLPRILRAIQPDDRQPHQHPEHPLRRIEDWVELPPPDSPECVARRRLLLEHCELAIREGVDGSSVLRALRYVMHPKHETTETDPGQGRTVTMRWSLLSRRRLGELATLSEQVADVVAAARTSQLAPIAEMIGDWAFPSRHAMAGVDDEVRNFMQTAATSLINLLIQRVPHENGLLHQLRDLAIRAPLDGVNEIRVSDEFDVLYPPDDIQDYRLAEQRHGERAKRLGTELAAAEPDAVIARLVAYMEQARGAGVSYPDLSLVVIHALAQQSQQPGALCEQLLTRGASWREIELTLRACMTSDAAFATRLLAELMTGRFRMQAGMLGILLLPRDSALFAQACGAIHGKEDALLYHARWKEVSEEKLVALLTHETEQLRAAAALGLWIAREGNIQPDVAWYETWLDAIALAPGTWHPLEEVVEADGRAALRWLQTKFMRGEARGYHFRESDVFEAACKRTAVDDRRALIDILRADMYDHDICRQLVGDNPILFERLLATELVTLCRLAPLANAPRNYWIDFALMALRAGFTNEDILVATTNTGGSFRDGEEVHGDLAVYFQELAANGPAEIRKLALAGVEFIRRDNEQYRELFRRPFDEDD